MEKLVINFSGKTPQKTDYPGIMEAVGQAVDEKREQILSAKENDRPVTIILPDHGVMAIALTQAVRGLGFDRQCFDPDHRWHIQIRSKENG